MPETSHESSCQTVTCVDRYILRIYLRTLAVCFASFSGIFVVFHAFGNIEDLVAIADRNGGMAMTLLRFYGPYAFLLFETTGTIVALLALLFTVGLLRRTGELTALLAAGISHGRIVRPMLIAAGTMLVLAAINRETMLPRWQDRLSMKADDLEDGGGEKPLLPCFDRMAGVLIKGRSLRLMQGEVVAPVFKIHAPVPGFGTQLIGRRATWLPASDTHPSGYVLHEVSSPEDIDSIASKSVSEHLVLRTSRDTDWLEPGQCFVSSDVELDFLRAGTAWMRMAGTRELVRRVSNPAVYCSADVRVTLHDRWLRPILDFSLIVLSLSLVVGRSERNMFMVTGYATALVGLFFGLRTLFHTLGGSGYLIEPATAAWIPLIVLAPLAYARYRHVQIS